MSKAGATGLGAAKATASRYRDLSRSNVPANENCETEKVSATRNIHDCSTEAHQSEARCMAALQEAELSHGDPSSGGIQSVLMNNKMQTRVTDKIEVAHAIDQINN